MCRLAGGEPLVFLPALIKYPGYDYQTETQTFPFRTASMLLSMFCLVSVSKLTFWLFRSGRLSKKHDYFKCIDRNLTGPDSEEMFNLRYSTTVSVFSYITTLQSIMNAKLSQHRFWRCHENGLIKTIETVPHNLYASVNSASLY